MLRRLSLLLFLACLAPALAHAVGIPASQCNLFVRPGHFSLDVLRTSEKLPAVPLHQELTFSTSSIEVAPDGFTFLPEAWRHGSKPRIISESATVDQRWEFLKDFPIRNLVANPGHRVIRRPEAPDDIAKHIKLGDFPIDLSEKGPAVNIVTDASGVLLSIDLWEGHHRMLGLLAADRETLGEMQKIELRIYVNGTLAPDFVGKIRPHIVPSFGVDFASSDRWFGLEPKEDRDPGHTYQTRPDPAGEGKKKDIIVSGKNSNFMLGSRETLGMVLKNIRREGQPTVGVFFVSEGRLPEFSVIEQKIAENKLGDLVFVWQGRNPKIEEAALIARWNQSLAAQGTHTTLNIYRGQNVDEFIRKHGESSFLQRIQQIFATTREIKMIGSRQQ